MYGVDSLLNCRCLNSLRNEKWSNCGSKWFWQTACLKTIHFHSFNKETLVKDNLTQKFRISLLKWKRGYDLKYYVLLGTSLWTSLLPEARHRHDEGRLLDYFNTAWLSCIFCHQCVLACGLCTCDCASGISNRLGSLPWPWDYVTARRAPEKSPVPGEDDVNFQGDFGWTLGHRGLSEPLPAIHHVQSTSCSPPKSAEAEFWLWPELLAEFLLCSFVGPAFGPLERDSIHIVPPWHNQRCTHRIDKDRELDPPNRPCLEQCFLCSARSEASLGTV